MERRAQGHLKNGDEIGYAISKFEGSFARVLERNDGTVPAFVKGYTAADPINGHHGQIKTTEGEFQIRFTPDLEESKKWHDLIKSGGTAVDVIVVHIKRGDSLDSVVLNVLDHLKTAHEARPRLLSLPD